MRNLEQFRNYESSVSSEKLLTSSEGSYLMSMSGNSLGKHSFKSSQMKVLSTEPTERSEDILNKSQKADMKRQTTAFDSSDEEKKK